MYRKDETQAWRVAVTRERILVQRLALLTQRFRAEVGTPASRHRQDPLLLAARAASARALVGEARALAAQHRAVHQGYLAQLRRPTGETTSRSAQP